MFMQAVTLVLNTYESHIHNLLEIILSVKLYRTKTKTVLVQGIILWFTKTDTELAVRRLGLLNLKLKNCEALVLK